MSTPCQGIITTHFWVYTGDEPEIGQECACGLAVWPYKPEFPHLDLREAS